jgi:hypothetical protein
MSVPQAHGLGTRDGSARIPRKRHTTVLRPVPSFWQDRHRVLEIEGPFPSCHSVENPTGSLKSCYTPGRSKIPKILIWVCGHGAGAKALYQGSASNSLILLVKPA